MSEFKYACPVCGQHIKCDSSQAGSVMDCPTCFQKITVPQAPASEEQKFILTGSKVVEKKTVVPPAAGGGAATGKQSPVAAIALIVILLLLTAGAGVFFFGGKLFHRSSAGDWQTSDIGAVGAMGAFSEAKGVFVVSGSGADIWSQADAFHYVYRALNGNGTLTARVFTQQNTAAWAKAGVMIRETLNPDSAFALALVTPLSGLAFQERSNTASPASTVLKIPQLAAPCWVRLVRERNTFSAFYSENGNTWIEMGSSTIPMAGQVYAGLAVCAHNNEALCQAQFDNVTLQTDLVAGQAKASATPKLVAPPASDAHWSLALDTNAIPDAPAAGRIHGQDFIVERASFQGGVLTLRSGARGSVEFGCQINFAGAQPEALAGKTINVMTNADKAARVSLRWKDAGGEAQKENYEAGYALRLEFGELMNSRLPGKIYLCTPDAEKSYLLGSFNADARKPKPKAPKN
jgi:regulation of enolase protein 1 (concanavalin A-like superfamily)/DNA-directed RNA polymerase subunit RPC12/RpoP